MMNVKELGKVFSPQELITVHLNDHPIFEGTFQEASPLLRVLVLRDGDHVAITSEMSADEPIMPFMWPGPPLQAG